MFVNYDGIHFNKEFIAGKTFKQLVKEADASKWFEGDPNKTDKLKELHKICGSSEQESPADGETQTPVIGN